MKRISKLDEMQEQELLRIEHNGCWLAFWMLLAVLIIENIFLRFEMKAIAGEWIVFFVLAVYLAFDSSRKGIWDRHLKMNSTTNLLVSIIPGALLGVLWAIRSYRDFHKPVGSLATGVFIGVTTFVLCFIVLSIAMKATAKRKAKMEEEPSDADEI